MSHWTDTGKRVSDPAKDQIDEWYETVGKFFYAPTVLNSNRRSKIERNSVKRHPRFTVIEAS